MRDALLLVDVLQTFSHADGDRLLASYRARCGGLRRAIADARARKLPIVYANDDEGHWDGDVRALVERARRGPAAELIDEVAPRPGDGFVVKPRYSAFDHTPLELLLGGLAVERVLLAGAATERCVAQTAIQAREAGLKVTVLAGACACVDEEDERIALRYLERIVGVRMADSSLALPGE